MCGSLGESKQRGKCMHEFTVPNRFKNRSIAISRQRHVDATVKEQSAY